MGSCWNTAMHAILFRAVWGLLKHPGQSFPHLSGTPGTFHNPSRDLFHLPSFLPSFLQEILLGQHSYHSWLSALKQPRVCICLPWASHKEHLFCLFYGLQGFNELEKSLNMPLNRGTINISESSRMPVTNEILSVNHWEEHHPLYPMRKFGKRCKTLPWKENPGGLTFPWAATAAWGSCFTSLRLGSLLVKWPPIPFS